MGWPIRRWEIADGRWGLFVNVNVKVNVKVSVNVKVKVEEGWHAGFRGWDRGEGACGGWERQLR